VSFTALSSQVLQKDIFWLKRALELAERAERLGEVPVGALITLNDEVIGEGFNNPIADHDPTAHAEIVAIRAAGQSLKNYRLVGATLYVTLEPCVMCMGAMCHARIVRVVYGASDPKRGAAGSALRLQDADFLNHRIEVHGGLLEVECGEQLRRFFREKR
jgi:tRNA(adenine34) deaminase